MARNARLTALCLCLIIALFLAVFLYFCRFSIASLYTTEIDVANMAAMLLLYEVFYQFPDAMQTNTLYALRGWNDTRAIFIISFIAYWIISIPLGCVLCLTDWITPMPLGVQGFWIALIAGLSVAALLYLLRIHIIEKRMLFAI